MDLRGHGESTNLGRFDPTGNQSIEFPWDSEKDVAAALGYLRTHPRIASTRIGVVGASYSGEETAEAARHGAPCRTYAALSPGSFSEEPIRAIDASAIPWLVIIGKDDPFLQSHITALQDLSRKLELLIIPGSKHATDILEDRPDLSERVAIWFAHILADPQREHDHDDPHQ